MEMEIIVLNSRREFMEEIVDAVFNDWIVLIQWMGHTREITRPTSDPNVRRDHLRVHRWLGPRYPEITTTPCWVIIKWAESSRYAQKLMRQYRRSMR